MKNSVCHADHDVIARGRSTTMARASGVMTPKVGQRAVSRMATGSTTAWRLGARTAGRDRGFVQTAWPPGRRRRGDQGRGRGFVQTARPPGRRRRGDLGRGRQGEAEVLFRWNDHQDEDVVDTRGEARFMAWWRH